MSSNGNEASYLAQLESTFSSLARMVADAKTELEQSQADRAGDARSGALGKDWQAIQARLDSGETTLADVFSGRDDTPEAEQLLQRSRANIAALAEETELPEETQEELAAQEAEWARVTRRPNTLLSDGPQPGPAPGA